LTTKVSPSSLRKKTLPPYEKGEAEKVLPTPPTRAL
jgi:hypothetical protein